MSKNEKIITEAIDRVRSEIENNPFGEIGFKLVTHAGIIKRIDFTITQKIGGQE